MQLSKEQSDGLTELVSIGFSRAASTLSALVGRRVLIETLNILYCSVADVVSAIEPLNKGSLFTMHQVFHGAFSGVVSLVMDDESTHSLVNLLRLNQNEQAIEKTARYREEVLKEIANILLSSFTGSFGNLLQVHIRFTVPSLHYESLADMINTMTIDHRELEVVIFLQVAFYVQDGSTNGYVFLIMGLHSFEALLKTMESSGYIK